MNHRINYLLTLILIALVVSQVYTSNKLATCGKQLVEFDLKAEALEEENRQLLSHNIEELSLTQLQEKAEELGFIEPSEIINLSQNQSFAYNP